MNTDSERFQRILTFKIDQIVWAIFLAACPARTSQWASPRSQIPAFGYLYCWEGAERVVLYLAWSWLQH